MSLGKNLYSLRKEKGISQDQLAYFVGVTKQTINDWELDVFTPNSNQLKVLSKELGVSIDKLLDGEGFNQSLKKEVSDRKKLLKFLYIIVALLWAIASIFSFISGRIFIGSVYLVLSCIWIFLAIILCKDVIKK